MISRVFDYYSLDRDKMYLYNDLLLDYLVFKYSNFSIEGVFYKVNSSIPNGLIRKRMFINTYSDVLNEYKATNNNELLIRVNTVNDMFYSNIESTYEELRDNLCHILKEYNNDIDEVLPLIHAFAQKCTNKELIYYESLMFRYLKDSKNLESKLTDLINQIKHSYYDLPLKYLTSDSVFLELLSALGVATIRDFDSVNKELLIAIISIDVEGTFSFLERLQNDYDNNFGLSIDNFLHTLTDREYKVLAFRYGFEGEEMTLDEVGTHFGVTRERIRQIEAKASKKLRGKEFLIDSLLVNMFFSLRKDNNQYISYEELVEYYKDEQIVRKVVCITEIQKLFIKYDEELKIFYNTQLFTPDDFVNEVLSIYGDTIEKNFFLSLNECEQRVINKFYRLVKNSVYVKRQLNISDIIAEVVDDIFPEGYKIDDEQTFNALITDMKNRYGDEFEVASNRAVDNSITRRSDYCLVGRGLYKRRTLCVDLSEDLVNKIIDYIYDNSPVCQYTMIFEYFKNDLQLIGIDNLYYLKGVLDPHLPDDFHTTRSEIHTTETHISGRAAVLAYAEQLPGVFSLQDLRGKFPGIKDYFFLNIFYNNTLSHKIIWLSNQRFTFLDRYEIDEKAIQDLKESLDKCFEELAEETISARKLFAKLSITNEGLISKLQICEDQFALFSLVRVLFADKYGFNRPLISKNKDIVISTEMLVYEYASRFDSFNYSLLKRFIRKMNIKGLYSYLNFIENISDDYVQVNVDTMVKKSVLNISYDVLLEIEKTLNFIFDKYSVINTESFNGYIMFPKIGYQWNKYLLAGVIRTYFIDKFEIENTEDSYDITNFIIRRIR